MGSYSLSMVLSALAGIGLGAMCYRVWALRAALNLRRIPEQWQLQARPLFTGVERGVWHWLKRAFLEHHVLVKIPVIRFLSPRTATQSQHSHHLLQGVYCSFTICTSDGIVVGCVDVPGSTGLKASSRDLKKKLFEECGIAYAVLSPNQLPTPDALRAAFLGDVVPAQPPVDELVTPGSSPLSQADGVGTIAPFVLAGAPSQAVPAPAAAGVASGPAQSGHETGRSGTPQGIDMTAVAAARSSLHSKLDKNRKVRLTKIDELSTSLGIVDDHTDQKFTALWDDSFIMGEEQPKSSDSRKP